MIAVFFFEHFSLCSILIYRIESSFFQHLHRISPKSLSSLNSMSKNFFSTGLMNEFDYQISFSMKRLDRFQLQTLHTHRKPTTIKSMEYWISQWNPFHWIFIRLQQNSKFSFVIRYYGVLHRSMVEWVGAFIILVISVQQWNYYLLVEVIHIPHVQIKQREMNNFFLDHSKGKRNNYIIIVIYYSIV